jgi:PilZ domain
MLVDVPVLGKVGDRLTSYFREFGKLDGHISDTKPGRFLLELDVSHAMREKLSNKLTWLEGKLKGRKIVDKRWHPRVVPARPYSTVTLADGSIHECSVIDMSMSGAAVCAQIQPPIGTPLAVGACVGRVVRYFADGFAIRFVETQHQYNLDRFVLRQGAGGEGGGRFP